MPGKTASFTSLYGRSFISRKASFYMLRKEQKTPLSLCGATFFSVVRIYFLMLPVVQLGRVGYGRAKAKNAALPGLHRPWPVSTTGGSADRPGCFPPSQMSCKSPLSTLLCLLSFFNFLLTWHLQLGWARCAIQFQSTSCHPCTGGGRSELCILEENLSFV